MRFQMGEQMIVGLEFLHCFLNYSDLVLGQLLFPFQVNYHTGHDKVFRSLL